MPPSPPLRCHSCRPRSAHALLPSFPRAQPPATPRATPAPPLPSRSAPAQRFRVSIYCFAPAAVVARRELPSATQARAWSRPASPAADARHRASAAPPCSASPALAAADGGPTNLRAPCHPTSLAPPSLHHPPNAETECTTPLHLRCRLAMHLPCDRAMSAKRGATLGAEQRHRRDPADRERSARRPLRRCAASTQRNRR